MTQENLQNILNAVYELEGLTTLALNGKQDKHRLRDLMVEKADYITALCRRLAIGGLNDVEMASSGGHSIPEPQEVPEVKRVAAIEAPVIAPVSEAPVVVKPKAAPAVPPKFASKSAQPPVGAPTPEKARVIFGPDKQPQSAAERIPLSKMFPLNEWFLFRRELFANSDDDFKASIAVAEDAGSIQKAEAYFYNDLLWNPEDTNVQAFINIVRNYYLQ